MKKNICLLSFVIASLLVVGGAGCNKQQSSSAAPPKTLQEGIAQLQASLANASPQAQSNFYAIYMGVRYTDYAKVTNAMQQLVSDPGLNDQQKKLVGDVGDLLKQAGAGQQNAAQPAH